MTIIRGLFLAASLLFAISSSSCSNSTSPSTVSVAAQSYIWNDIVHSKLWIEGGYISNGGYLVTAIDRDPGNPTIGVGFDTKPTGSSTYTTAQGINYTNQCVVVGIYGGINYVAAAGAGTVTTSKFGDSLSLKFTNIRIANESNSNDTKVISGYFKWRY